MGLFKRDKGYRPLTIAGKGQVQLFDPSAVDKRAMAAGVELVQHHALYSDDDYMRIGRDQADKIKVVQSVLTSTNDPDEAEMIGRLFMEGWFVGCLESVGGRARHGYSSPEVQFALTLMKQSLPEQLQYGRNALEAGYFAQRSAAPAEALWGLLNDGAAFNH